MSPHLSLDRQSTFALGFGTRINGSGLSLLSSEERLADLIHFCWSCFPMSPDVDQSVRIFIAAQGGGMSETDVTDMINEAVQWVREH